jgi:hypothetical protein
MLAIKCQSTLAKGAAAGFWQLQGLISRGNSDTMIVVRQTKKMQHQFYVDRAGFDRVKVNHAVA